MVDLTNLQIYQVKNSSSNSLSDNANSNVINVSTVSKQSTDAKNKNQNNTENSSNANEKGRKNGRNIRKDQKILDRNQQRFKPTSFHKKLQENMLTGSLHSNRTEANNIPDYLQRRNI